MTPSTRHSRRFRVIGEEDDPAEALEDLKRKKKAEHKREMKKKEEKGSAAVYEFHCGPPDSLIDFSTQAQGRQKKG